MFVASESAARVVYASRSAQHNHACREVAVRCFRVALSGRSRTDVVTLLALACLWVCPAPAFAQATRLTVLHNFSGVDGRMPQSGLARGNDGSFYGTTYAAGANDGGTVFRITAAG